MMRSSLSFLSLLLLGCGAPASSSGASPTAPVAPGGPGAPLVAGDGTSATGPASASDAAAAPTPMPVAAPPGPFSEARVREIVRAHFDKVGDCYSAGLERDPALAGTIELHLSIDDDGRVVGANAKKVDPKNKPPPARPPKPKRWGKKPPPEEPLLTDPEVVTCVEQLFRTLRFPETGRGLITLVYPVVLRVER